MICQQRDLHLSALISDVDSSSGVNMSHLFAGPSCFSAELNVRGRTRTILASNVSDRHKQGICCVAVHANDEE